MPPFLKKPPIYIAGLLAAGQMLTGVVGDLILLSLLVGLVAHGASK